MASFILGVVVAAVSSVIRTLPRCPRTKMDAHINPNLNWSLHSSRWESRRYLVARHIPSQCWPTAIYTHGEQEPVVS